MIKRPMMFAAVLFFIGIFASAYDINTYPVILLFTSVSCGALYIKRRGGIYLLAAIMIFSGSFAMEYAASKRADIQSEFSGRSEKMTLTVTEFSENNRAFVSFKYGKRRIKAYLTVKSDTTLLPGDIIEGDFLFSAPFSEKAGASGFANYLSGKNAFLTVKADKVSLTRQKTDGIEGKIYSLRRYMNSIGENHFSGDKRTLFNAMLFGDKSLISGSLDKSLQASGLNHIVVVSGMHLSVIIAFVMFFVHKLFGKSRLGLIPAFLAALIVTMATGAGTSIIRAFIMISLFLLSQTLYRDNDSLTSLFSAAFIMGLINPFVIFDAGFILSVLSVLGIILYKEKFSLFFGRFIPQNVSEVISLSLSAQVAVMPALAYYFGIVTPYALLSNLLVVTVSSLYVTSGMIFLLIPQSRALQGLLGISSKAIIAVCNAVEKLPCSVISLGDVDAVFIVLWILILALMSGKNNKFVLQWLKLRSFCDIM